MGFEFYRRYWSYLLFIGLAVVEAVALAHGHVVFSVKVIVYDAFVERMNGVIKPRYIFKMNGRPVDFGDSVFASAPVNYGNVVGSGWVVDRDPIGIVSSFEHVFPALELMLPLRLRLRRDVLRGAWVAWRKRSRCVHPIDRLLYHVDRR